MNFITNLLKKVETYNIKDLRVIYVKKIEKIEDIDGAKIAKFTPDYQIMIAKLLLNQSSDRCKRYYVIGKDKIIEEMPTEYYNIGDNAIVQSYPLEHFCKHRAGGTPFQNRFKAEQILQLEQIFDNKFNDSRISSISKK